MWQNSTSIHDSKNKITELGIKETSKQIKGPDEKIHN